MKKRVIISTIVATLLVGVTTLSANSANTYHDSLSSKESKAVQNPSAVPDHAQAVAKVEETMSKDHYRAKLDADNFKTQAQRGDARRLHKIIDNEIKTHRLATKKAPKEIMSGLKETMIALRALRTNNKVKAKEALASATKFFDTGLKNNPKLDLVPVAQNIAVNDFTGNAKVIKHIINSAEKLLIDNETQVARAMLLPLQDEIVFNIQALPIKLYAQATKQAQKDLAKGKNRLVFGDIVTALNSVVVNRIVIPLPLLTAQDLVVDASKLDKTHKKEALKLLNLAQDELQKAVLLGYTKKHSKMYKSLDKELSVIKNEINGQNHVEKMYEHIKHSFESLLDLHRKDVQKNVKK